MKEKLFMNTEVKEWLLRAKSNLEFAKKVEDKDFFINGGYIFIEEVCFELQQSVEKSIKALMIDKKIKIPKTHSISDLIARLEENSIYIPENIKLAKILTEYAVETRYPNFEEPLTENDFKEALDIAQNVYNWIESQLI
jgi:HEPN domain-containing protein